MCLEKENKLHKTAINYAHLFQSVCHLSRQQAIAITHAAIYTQHCYCTHFLLMLYSVLEERSTLIVVLHVLVHVTGLQLVLFHVLRYA